MKLEDMSNEELLSELYQSYYAACCTRSAKIEEAIIKTKDFLLKEAELHKRLDEGAKAIEIAKHITALRFESGKQVAIKQPGDLFCCGNCDHCRLSLSEEGDCWFPLCKIRSERVKHFNYCSCWKSDGMTRKQREI